MSYDTPAGIAQETHSADGALRTAGRQLRVVPVTDAATWAGLVAQAPKPHLTQCFAYGEGKRAKGWTVKRVSFLDGDSVVAFCQILELRLFGLRLLSRINRGPVFLESDPPVPRMRDVYRTIRQIWGRVAGGPLLLAPALEASPMHRDLLVGLGFRPRKAAGWNSMRIDLEPAGEAIHASFASTFRNRLRAAERSGITLAIVNDGAAVDWMVARHADNMRNKRFRAADGTFIRELRAAAPDDYLVFQALLAGKPVAGMSVVRFGSVAEYHTGWFGPEGRQANSGNFLMWSIVREMKRRGCLQFDVGGLYDSHRYTQFKRGMRGTEFSLAGEWIAL
ncbi:MAG: GNAT family N-acetyltransferase [Devosia sp.]|nr:GNAT family N-acetyltransferase [Devosia sp.]